MWTPDEWQVYCREILQLHYGPTGYQHVPDTHPGGDLGIDGFSLRDGCAYQFYAPEEPYTTEKLYERQRDKINGDLKKLAKNDKAICKLLGEMRIQNWVLLTPLFNSRRLVEHAMTKAIEVRGLRLDCVADEFQAFVQDDSAFPLERAALVSGAVQEVKVTIDDVEPAQLDLLTQGRPGLIDTLVDKIRKIPTLSDQSAQSRFCNDLLGHYVRGGNVLGQLKVEYPDTWQAVVTYTAVCELTIAGESMLSGVAPNVVFMTILRDYERKLGERWPALRQYVSLLAWSAMAGWMMHCNLDFPNQVVPNAR